jgi:hypothetical protein
MRGVLDVAWHQHGLAAGGFDQALRLLGILVLMEVGDHDVRPFPGEGDGNSAANAAIGTGNDRPLAFEAA